ncbi:recombinase family protein [Micromonospora eburnea]|uniref:Site-specific DNA recombinase n=1 Tax=Micromonospora eburnea TaxID=227316 RepID=A0A1C6V388_9ACTN|nr:recombinase family protein [Micromonospora eburnea]SCL60587.1 Site-specific DNA recombinase [Micromonospora eburnea]
MAAPATREATIKEHVILNDDPAARENLIGLARVSTDAQELARQIDALKTAGCARIYLDKASGAKGTTRPGLTAALDHMRRDDTLVVLDLTRLGRDTRELLAIVEDDLHAKGRHFRILDGIVLDTSDDMCGELIFTVFAAIAKFQRQQIVKGTREGLDAARARGRVGGRPRALTPNRSPTPASCSAPGKPRAAVAAKLRVSRWTLSRALDTAPR